MEFLRRGMKLTFKYFPRPDMMRKAIVGEWNWPTSPKVAVSLGVLGATFLYYDSRMKLKAIDRTIVDGNCGQDPSSDNFVEKHVVDRRELIETITDSFITDTSHGFGVILGPTGSGKTFAMRQACFNTPRGTLYFEIKGVQEFPKELAKAVGMRTERTIIGTFIGRFFPSWIQGYYTLPLEYEESLDYVIRVLGERARVFTMKNGHSPCLFIDAVDLLAKYNKRLFIKLVDLAKGYSNEGGLRLIFGCNEGYIIPVIFTSTSSNSRSWLLEVVDLEEEDAVKYLIDWRMKREFAIRLVEMIGTRMIFLERAVRFYKALEPKCKTEEELFGKVLEELKIIFTKRGLDTIIREKPRSIEIIDHLTRFNIETGFDPQDFFEGLTQDEAKQKAYRETVENLVTGNALRYTRRGNVTWHNKLIEQLVKKRYLKS